MIYKHLLLEKNNKKTLYLFLDYSYEFSEEKNFNKRQNKIVNKINQYIQSNHINYNKEDIMIVSNNIIIGTLNLHNNKYNEYIDKFEKEKIDVIDMYDGLEIVDNYNDNSLYQIDKYIKTNDNEFISFTNYLMYLIATEIPITYEKESLKVYSIIFRTSIMHSLSEEGKVYVNVNFYNHALKNLWNENYDYYYSKLKKIISDTNHLVLYYKNNYFDPLFYNNIYHIPLNINTVNTLAKKGYNYKEIIKYFYPDCVLINKTF